MTNRSTEQETVTGSAVVRDKKILSGLPTAQTLEVYFSTQALGQDVPNVNRVTLTNEWLRIVQATHWRLTVGRGAGRIGRSP